MRVLEDGKAEPKSVTPFQMEGMDKASNLKKLQRMKRRAGKRFRSYDKDGQPVRETKR